jgi:hypothetical protein
MNAMRGNSNFIREKKMEEYTLVFITGRPYYKEWFNWCSHKLRQISIDKLLVRIFFVSIDMLVVSLIIDLGLEFHDLCFQCGGFGLAFLQCFDDFAQNLLQRFELHSAISFVYHQKAGDCLYVICNRVDSCVYSTGIVDTAHLIFICAHII